MRPSILIAISKWVMKKFEVEESLKEVGVEVLQKCLWTPLKNKIIKFFVSEEETEEFIERISTIESNNVNKPSRDVEDVYEEIKGEPPIEELFDTIATFFRENQDLLKKINSTNNNGTRNITYYQKGKVIYNNVGVQHITNNPKQN